MSQSGGSFYPSRSYTRAMILESSSESLVRVKESLEILGCNVPYYAGKGTGWAESFAKNKIQLAVVDYMLPGRHGLHCLKRILEMDSSVYVIFTHSFEGLYANEIEAKAFAMGARQVFAKPFTKKKFLKMVAPAIGVELQGADLG